MSLYDRAKRVLVGTAAGRSLERTRERRQVSAAALSDVGGVANDILAVDLVVRLARGCSDFLDIGGHIGSCGSRVLALSPSTRVTFVEAVPEKADFLRRKYPTAVVHECAAGHTAGEVDFFIDPVASGYSSLASLAAGRRIRVAMRRLDDLVHKADVIKLDIEGAELGALRGGQRLIESQRPIVMFESAPGAGDRLGFSLEELHQWWSSIGFGIYVPNRIAHEAPPLSLDGFVDSHEFPRRCLNYFALPHDRRIAIRDRARRLLRV